MENSLPDEGAISENREFRRTKSRSTKLQIQFLTKYMDSNKEFADSVHKTYLIDVRRRWLELRDELNKLGPVRSLEQWKTCWRDQKLKRARIALAQRSQASVDANQPTPTKFTFEIIQELSDDDAPAVLVVKNELDEDVVWAPEQSAPTSTPHQNSNPPSPSNDPGSEASNEENETSNDEETEPSNGDENEQSNDGEYAPSNEEEEQPCPAKSDPLVSSPRCSNQSALRTERRGMKRRMLRRKNHTNNLPQQLLNAQIELNGLIKGLVKEVRRSNILREEHIRILKKQNGRTE